MKTLTLMLAVLAWTGDASAQTQSPWLFLPTTPAGAVGCPSSNAAEYLAREVKGLGYKSWEELAANSDQRRWNSFLDTDGCVVFPPNIQWEELGADNMVAFMRLYSSKVTMALFFQIGDMSDAKGNHPRVTNSF